MKTMLMCLIACILLASTGYAQQSQNVQEEVYKVAEQMPEYPGGDDSLLAYVYRNIKYPELAKKNNVEGTVVVSFVVTKEGKVKDARLLRDIGAGCGKEALRVVNTLPVWKPGMQRGEKVNVQFNLPIKFRLPIE